VTKHYAYRITVNCGQPSLSSALAGLPSSVMPTPHKFVLKLELKWVTAEFMSAILSRLHALFSRRALTLAICSPWREPDVDP
jgi:hypothetical protein